MPKFEEASWEIPHCQVTETGQGFRVVLPRKLMADSSLMSALRALFAVGLFLTLPHYGFKLTSRLGGDWKTAGDYGLIGLLIGLAAALSLIWWLLSVRTVIEITTDAVVIDEKYLRRSDFGGFLVLGATTTKSGRQLWRLGYQYGSESKPFGGNWVDEVKAQEFIIGLNRRMASVVAPEDVQPASPDSLRNTRPTTF